MTRRPLPYPWEALAYHSREPEQTLRNPVFRLSGDWSYLVPVGSSWVPAQGAHGAGVMALGTVVFEELVGGSGYYDHSTGKVHVATGKGKGTTLCTVVHETVHRALGHNPQDGEIPAQENQRELSVDRLAARILIPFPCLVRAFTVCADRDQILAALGVDEDTLFARLFGLDALERTMFELCARMCIGLNTAAAGRPWPVESITGGTRAASMVA